MSTRARLIALALVVVGGAGGAFVALRDDGDGGSGEETNEPRLESIDVPAGDLRTQWNDAIAELGSGDELPEPDWVADAQLGLDVSEHAFGDWGVVDLYRHPNGDLAAVDLLTRYVSVEERARFRVDAIAATAAALGIDVDAATALLDVDLGLADAAGEPNRTIEHGDASVTVNRSATNAEVRISGPAADGG
jgi:hypothetical protein